MATYFKNVLLSEIGTTETTALTTPDNAKITVIGLSLTNLTASIILASVRVAQLDQQPGEGITTTEISSAYYIKEVAVPPNQSIRVVNGGEKLVLGSTTSVLIQASQDYSLDLVLSYVEIV